MDSECRDDFDESECLGDFESDCDLATDFEEPSDMLEEPMTIPRLLSSSSISLKKESVVSSSSSANMESSTVEHLSQLQRIGLVNSGSSHVLLMSLKSLVSLKSPLSSTLDFDL